MRKRSTVHPLSVHLGMAASNAEGIHSYSFGKMPSTLVPRLVEIVQGIKQYQECEHVTDRKELDIVWQSGFLRILRYSTASEADLQKKPLLIIPSLVNRSYIFNLNEDHSFLKYMEGQGIAAYLLDWGDIDIDAPACTMGEIIRGIIPHVCTEISRSHGGRKINALGYCMGGNLLLGSRAFSQDIDKILLLATPMDFHDPEFMLSGRVRLWQSHAFLLVQEKGFLPSEWVQVLFASLDPEGSAQKFASFSKKDPASEEAKLFIDVEDWLNDGVNMPAEIARHSISEWFGNNVLAANAWFVDGEHVNLATIEGRIFIVASGQDRLVPFSCAASAKEILRRAEIKILKADCGHIGFIASRQAAEKVWHPIATWVLEE